MLDRPPKGSIKAHQSKLVRRGLANIPNFVQFLVSRQFAYLESEAEDEDDEDAANFYLPDALDQLTLEDNLRFVGFGGRCNKPADTCYCWWVGGALSVEFLNPYLDILRHRILTNRDFRYSARTA
jgi:geranylgeranyl transferase type-1 subunit beta